MILTVKLSDKAKLTWWVNEPKHHNSLQEGTLDIQTEHGFVELTVSEQIELLRFLQPRYHNPDDKPTIESLKA